MAITDVDNSAPATAQSQNTSDTESDTTRTDKKKKNKKKDTFSNGRDTVEINPDLKTVSENSDKTLVLSWGRMNPPTVGHEKLINKVKQIAREKNGTPHVMLTHSQDKKKNPLQYADKIKLAKAAFGNDIIHGPSREKTLIDVLKSHQRMANKIIMVAGSDRVKEYETLLNKYNGKEYNYDSIEVVSAGERDPDAEGASGMSASKMREAASKNDLRSFTNGLPSRIKSQAKSIFDMVRAGMQLSEELEAEGLLDLDEAVLSLAQRRKRAIVMRRFKNKIARARALAKKRMAKEKNLRNRAQRMARQIVRKRVAGQRGSKYSNLSVGDKMAIDKMVDKRQALVQKLAKKLYPRVKSAEVKRLVKARTPTANLSNSFEPEYINMIIENMQMHEINEVFDILYEAQVKDPDVKMAVKKRREADLDATGKRKAMEEETSYLDYLEGIFEEAEGRLLEDAVTGTRERHKSERERMKKKHDREMDRARSADTRAVNRETTAEASIPSLVKKAETSGINYNTLAEVYKRGIESFKNASAGQTAEQYAFARVNSYINKGKTFFTLDSDLHEAELDPQLEQRINSARHRLMEQLEAEKVKLREGEDRIRTLGRMADIKYRIEHIEDEYEQFDSNKVAEMVFEAMKEPSVQEKKVKLRNLAKMGLVDPGDYAEFDTIMNRIQSQGGDTDKLTHKQKSFLSKIYDKLTDVIAADPTIFMQYKRSLQKAQRSKK